VLLGEFLGGPDKLNAYQFVAASLESLEYFTNKSTLDTIRLDGNESTLELGSWETSVRYFIGSKNGLLVEEESASSGESSSTASESSSRRPG